MARRDEEINSLRYDIEDMDRERHKLRSLVIDLDEQLVAESKKRFELEQEIDKLTRSSKGKQPSKSPSQNNKARQNLDFSSSR